MAPTVNRVSGKIPRELELEVSVGKGEGPKAPTAAAIMMKLCHGRQSADRRLGAPSPFPRCL